MASQSTLMSTDRSNLNIYSRTIAVISQCTISQLHTETPRTIYIMDVYIWHYKAIT